MKMSKKMLAALLAVVMLVGAAIGGTLAWLATNTDPVVNTFTPSDINVTLTETTGNEYVMVPGFEIEKNPVASVTTGSVDAWLFVKLEKSANYGTYLNDPVIASGWTAVSNEAGVYGRKVLKDDQGTEYHVLADDKLTVKSSVVKSDMEAIQTSGQPTLTVTAYATQLYSSANTEFTIDQAWANVGNPSGQTQ